jgi:hypothetical protein
MENKSHWIFDYMKSSYRDKSVPHNFIPKEKENEKPKPPDVKKYGQGSFKNEKRHVAFSSQHARSISEADSFVEPKHKSRQHHDSVFKPHDKDRVESQIEEEFNRIDSNLDEIRLLSEKATRENSIIENSEIKESVLSEIGGIERKVQEIRNILSKNY